MHKWFRIFALCLAVLILPEWICAQNQLGALTGSVYDVSGAVIPEATITITSTDSGAKWVVKSSSAGYYRIPVPPGTYQVVALQKGFKESVAKNVLVAVEQVVTLDLTLQVGAETQTVTVTSEAPLLTPSTAEVGGSVSPEEFQTLPVFISDGGRQIDTFVWESLPGTTPDWSPLASISGGQDSSNSIVIDGVSIGRYDYGSDLGEQTPGTDAVGEFKVQEANYSAEYGTTGGGIENFTIKSGTNQFHGNVDEFNNNPIFNANGWSNNAEGGPKSNDKENNFAASLGGPIRKNKTFFFFNYEGDRKSILSVGGLTTVPTPGMLKGDFSSLLYASNPVANPNLTPGIPNANTTLTQVGTDALGRPVNEWQMYDPTTTRDVLAGATDPVTGLVNSSGADAVIRDPFSGNQIPASEFSSATSSLLSYFPNPGNGSLFRNEPYVGATCCPFLDRNAETFKLDEEISTKQKLSGTLIYAMRHRTFRDNPQSDTWFPFPNYPLSPDKVQDVGGPQVRLLYSLTVNDHSVNTLSLGYNRFGNGNNKTPGGPAFAAAMGIPGIATTCFPVQKLANKDDIQLVTQFGVGCASRDPTESYSYQDVYSTTHAKHSLKFGGQLLHYRYDTYEPPSPSFSFSSIQTELPGFQSNTGDALASWLMGAANGGSATEFTTEPGYRAGIWSFFAQDDWRATSRLTLNLGFRWEIPQPKSEAFNRMSQFSPAATQTLSDGTVLNGAIEWLGSCATCVHSNTFQNHYFGDVSPRFGLAYQLTQKMVFRGGYGISYQPPTQNGWGPEALMGYNQGYTRFRASGEVAAVNPLLYLSNFAGAAAPGPVGLPPYTGTLPNRDPTIMNGYEPDFFPANSLTMPRVQNWSAGLQYEFPKQVLVEANYVGSKGTRLFNKDFGSDWGQVNSRFMGLGDQLVDDFQGDLSNPTTAATLAQYGITQLPYSTFENDNYSTSIAAGLAPFPQYSGIINDQPTMGSSIYHSLQIQARKNSSHGLTFIAAYTVSKDISDSDSVMYNSTYIQDFYNRKLERSITSFDYPQVVKLTWIYSLPLGRGQKFLSSSRGLDRIVGGWQVTAIQRYGSGDPLSLYDNDYSPSITPYARPDVVQGVKQTVPLHGLDAVNGTGYLNEAAFADPPLSPENNFPLRVGTAPRELPNLRGPAHQEEDFGVLKTIPITERVKFQLRGDFQNVLNRVGRGDPDTTVNDGTFGEIFGPMNGPRLVQLGGHLTF
jgi:hypothetical protein